MNDVYLYTVDDLKDVIDENIRSRQEAAKQAEEIIDTQVVHFMDWLNSLDSVSTIRAIREQALDIQQQALDTALKKLQQGGEPDRIMQELAYSLTNKLIHNPSSRLRNASAKHRDELYRQRRNCLTFLRTLLHPTNPGSRPGYRCYTSP